MLGAVRTVVVPDDTRRLVVAPDTVELMFWVVVPDTFELTVALVLAGLFTVSDELPPFPRLTAMAPEAELASAPLMPVPTAVLDCASADVDSRQVMAAAVIYRFIGIAPYELELRMM
jgi:hypothetical protein